MIKSAIQVAIALLTKSAQDLARCFTMDGEHPSWTPSAKSAHDEFLFAAVRLQDVGTHIAVIEGDNAAHYRAGVAAHHRITQLETENAAHLAHIAQLESQLAAPRGTDAQILKERTLTAEMISGCIGYGYNGDDFPPDSHAWMRPFYAIGAKEAELEAQLAAETGRLDFVIKEFAFVEHSDAGSRLKAVCEFDEQVSISGDGLHPTPRAAIDAARELAKGGA